MEGRGYTRAELAQNHGRAGAPALFAYLGIVYDATGSFQWQQGRHWATHFAGQDLSGELAQAPHGEDLLKRLKVVGWLVEEEKASPTFLPGMLSNSADPSMC